MTVRLLCLVLLVGCGGEQDLGQPECVSSGEARVRAAETVPDLGFSADQAASEVSVVMPVRVAAEFDDSYTWSIVVDGTSEVHELTGEVTPGLSPRSCPAGPILVAQVAVRMTSALGLDVKGEAMLHATGEGAWLRGLFYMDEEAVPDAYGSRLDLCERLMLGPDTGGFDPASTWEQVRGGVGGSCGLPGLEWVRVP